tara:strand:- start:4368 stop:5291 length:924 start_codon:yes stop_codon:yes gene_type:complete
MFKKNKKYILDGGSGQTLMEMGLRTTGDLWSAQALIDKNLHYMVLNMHKDFINSGSELIVTANFSVRRRLLERYNLLDSLKVATQSAGEIASRARNESNKKVIIAGSLPNQGNTYSPIQFETEETIYKYFFEIANILNNYVDIFYLDVLSSIKEIKLALEATKKFKKQVLVGVHLRYDANLPSGETLNQLFENIKDYNCCGIISACVSPEIVELSLPILDKQNLPFGYKMNLFKNLPTNNENTFNEEGFEGDREYEDPIELLGTRNNEYLGNKYKNFVISTLGKGASLIGGCCEIKPRHITLLKSII